MTQTGSDQDSVELFLKILTKFLCVTTFGLIFAGAMVTSTDSGLAVPDWPLSYGMLFPPMVGGVLYEHGHRMVASFVGLLTLIVLILTLWKVRDKLRRRLATVAFILVCLQGMLGGMTVLLGLPLLVSVGHSLLGQTFLLVTVALVFYYHQANCGEIEKVKMLSGKLILSFLNFFLIILYLQNFLGALVRHTHSALAIYDVPLNLGRFVPSWWKEETVNRVNQWLFERGYDAVEGWQIGLHYAHRIGAICIIIGVLYLIYRCLCEMSQQVKIFRLIVLLVGLILFQIFLGLATVSTGTNAVLSSFHVLGGASLLALTLRLRLEVGRLV